MIMRSLTAEFNGGNENASTNTYLSAETITQLASVIKMTFDSTQRRQKNEQAIKSELFHG